MNHERIQRITESVHLRTSGIPGKKIIPVYIEINIGSEITKDGLKPDYEIIESLVREVKSSIAR